MILLNALLLIVKQKKINTLKYVVFVYVISSKLRYLIQISI